MILKSVRARNFKRFTELNVEGLPASGVIGVLGLNESGKSTFGEAISYALFGLTPSAGQGQTRSLLKWGAPFFEVSVAFELGGEPYVCYRRYRQDGPTECYLLNEREGVELAVGERQVSEKISSLLGLGFEEFRHSLYVAQKELALITDPRVRRRDVLEGMLGLNRLREVDREVARQLQALENERNLENIRMEEIQRLDEEIARVKGQSEKFLEERDAILSERQHRQTLVTQTEQQLREMETARENLREAEGLSSLVSERRAALKAVDEKLAQAALSQMRFDELGRELDTLRQDTAGAEDDLKDLDRKTALYQAHSELATRLQNRREELAGIEQQLADLREHKALMDEAEAAAEEATRQLQTHLDLLGRFPTQDTCATAVARLRLLYDALSGKYESFRGRVMRELEKQDRAAKELEQAEAQAKAAVQSPGTPPVAAQEIAALRHQLDTESLKGASLGAMLAIVVGVVTPVMALSVLMGPWALMGLLGLGALAIPYQKDQQRLQDLLKGRQKLQEMEARQSRHAGEEQAYQLALAAWEKAQADLQKTQNNLAYHRRLLAFWDDLPIGTLAQVRESAAALGEFSDTLTDELLDLLSAFLREAASLGPLLPQDHSLKDYFNGGFAAVYRDTLARREEVHRRIGQLKKQTLGRPALMRQMEQLLTQAAEVGQLVESLERELPGFRLPPEPLADVQEQTTRLREQLAQMAQRREAAMQERDDQRRLLAQRVPLERERASLIEELGRLTETLYGKKGQSGEEDLSEPAFAQVLATLEQHKAAHAATFVEEARLMGMREQSEETLRRLKARQQEERRIAQRLKLLDRRREELVTLRECLAITLDRVRRRIVPQIRAYFSHILGKLTAGRYHEVEMDEEFDMTVYSPERGGLVDISHLSGGTADQMFIALRLALARTTSIGDSGPGRPFLFLDEPLSAFDTDRRALFMQLLRDMQPNFQQIFLISHLPDISRHLDHHLTLEWDGVTLAVHKSWTTTSAAPPAAPTAAQPED